VFTLADGNVITLIGTSVGDKRWVQVQSTRDAALAAKTKNRAYELASYRFDAIFRPVDQLLVPKETKDTKAPATAPAAPGRRKPASGASSPLPQASPGP
jgi:hypothetical protein